MTGILEKIYRAGRGSVASTKSLSKLFSPFDKEYIRERVRISDKAKSNGSNNLPKTNATELDSVESEIFSSASHALGEYLDEYETQIEAYRIRINENRKILEEFSTLNEFKRSMGDLRGLITELRNSLYNQEESVKALVEEILGFRRKAVLLQRTPDIRHPAKVIFGLAFAGLLEMGLTAALIRDSGDFFSVLSIALIFFILNVVVVFGLLGPLTRWINCNKDGKADWLRRSIGYVSILGFVGYSLLINLVFSHLRSVSSEVEALLSQNAESYLEAFQNIGLIAWQEFTENGFKLQDVYSYALLVFGVVISLYAITSGYVHNDKYPGYGRYRHRYDSLFEHYCDSAESIIAQFAEARDEGVKKAEAAVKKLKDTYQIIPGIISNASGLSHRFNQAYEALNVDLKILLQEYREENIRARTEPPPAYFSGIPRLQAPHLNVIPESAIVPKLEIVEEIEEHRDNVFKLFDEAIKDVRDLRSVLESKYPFQIEGSGHGQVSV